MHLSGHKNEASVRSYNRDCSMQEKKKNGRHTSLFGYPIIHNFKSRTQHNYPTCSVGRNSRNSYSSSKCPKSSTTVIYFHVFGDHIQFLIQQLSSTSEITSNSFVKFDSASHNKHDCDMAVLDCAHRLVLLREAVILNVKQIK